MSAQNRRRANGPELLLKCLQRAQGTGPPGQPRYRAVEPPSAAQRSAACLSRYASCPWVDMRSVSHCVPAHHAASSPLVASVRRGIECTRQRWPSFRDPQHVQAVRWELRGGFCRKDRGRPAERTAQLVRVPSVTACSRLLAVCAQKKPSPPFCNAMTCLFSKGHGAGHRSHTPDAAADPGREPTSEAVPVLLPEHAAVRCKCSL
jgi:hypothetical protein